MKLYKILLLLFAIVGCKSTHSEIKPEMVQIIQTSKIVNNTKSNSLDLCSWDVKFSPKGGAEDQIVSAINSAQKSIYVQAYSFTSLKIAQALIVKSHSTPVEILLDPSNKTVRGSMLNNMLDSDASVYFDESHAIAHNKVMIIDEEKVITGSFNFTAAAENKNAENSLILTCPGLAAEYKKNWDNHKFHSKKVK